MQFFPCFSNHFYHVNPVDKIKESSHFETCSSPVQEPHRLREFFTVLRWLGGDFSRSSDLGGD